MLPVRFKDRDQVLYPLGEEDFYLTACEHTHNHKVFVHVRQFVDPDEKNNTYNKGASKLGLYFTPEALERLMDWAPTVLREAKALRRKIQKRKAKEEKRLWLARQQAKKDLEGFEDNFTSEWDEPQDQKKVSTSL